VNREKTDPKGNFNYMNIQTKILIFLIILGIIDMVIPVPILGVILIYVVAQKPPWFADAVSEIYKSG
jgi:hypothetical protein